MSAIIRSIDLLLDRCQSKEHENNPDKSQKSKRKQTVLKQLQDVPLEHLQELASDFSQITFRHPDGYRLELKLGLDFPEVPPQCSSEDLPQALDLSHWTPLSTLQDVYELFLEQMEHSGPVLAQLNEFDGQTWVLEKSHFSRRVVISPLVSVQIALDPLDPNCLEETPSLRFLGPDIKVQEYMERLAERKHLFDPERNMLANLEKILELEFPHPEEIEKEDFKIECCICFSHHLGSALPDLRCPFPKCHRAFHVECLYEWLRGTCDNKTMHNFIHGSCPYCHNSITCPCPKDNP